MRIKTGDNVVVITGKDKGKTGTVVAAKPTADKVIVEGLNMIKKYVRQSEQNPDWCFNFNYTTIRILFTLANKILMVV